MRFDGGGLVYSQLLAVPLYLARSPNVTIHGDLHYPPDGRAPAVEILYTQAEDNNSKLLVRHLSGRQAEATFWNVLDFPVPALSPDQSQSPQVVWHPSPSICVCAVAFAGQLGLFCAATDSSLCSWATGRAFQRPAMSHLDGVSWASHGFQLSLTFKDDGELRLECDSQ